jgi:hypothetical protein
VECLAKGVTSVIVGEFGPEQIHELVSRAETDWTGGCEVYENAQALGLRDELVAVATFQGRLDRS